MRITADQLDPDVFQSLMSSLHLSVANPNPSLDQRRVQMEDQRRFRPDFGPLKKWLLGGALVATGAAAAMFGTGWEIQAQIGLAVGIWNGIFWTSFTGGMIASFRNAYREANVIHSDLLAGWIPHLRLTRAERAYCETVALLARPETVIDETTGRQLLKDLNELMAQSRRINAQRAELRRVSGEEALAILEEEKSRIASRLAESSDSQARADLQESLALCESRIESARTALPALERLDAQEEKIVQTVASLQSRIARIETTAAQLQFLDVEDVRHTLNELTAQTRSVEDAVQEVLSVQP